MSRRKAMLNRKKVERAETNQDALINPGSLKYYENILP